MLGKNQIILLCISIVLAHKTCMTEALIGLMPFCQDMWIYQ